VRDLKIQYSRKERFLAPLEIADVIYFVVKIFFNFIDIFIFIKPFRNKKDLIGLPKIALRKLGTKTYKKIWGMERNSNILVGVYDF